jgi:hypothetical protein
MAIKGRFRGYSRKKTSAGDAFGKKTGGQKWAGKGKFGDLNFLKRLLGKAGIFIGGPDGSGQTELLLLAQLGDSDAIQLLVESGLDAKDNLGLSSLTALALQGDGDAIRLLMNKGFNIAKKVTAEDIDGPLAAAWAMGISNISNAAEPPATEEKPAENTDENSLLKKALSLASQKSESIQRAPKQESFISSMLNFSTSKPLA